MPSKVIRYLALKVCLTAVSESDAADGFGAWVAPWNKVYDD